MNTLRLVTKMAETPETRKILENQRNTIRRKLREISPQLMRELESVELALRNLSPDAEYASYKLAIDAIEAWLRNNGHSEKGSVIADALISGGWRRLQKPNTREREPIYSVLDSIRFHLKPANDTRRIKAISGDFTNPGEAVIELYEWGENSGTAN